MCCLFGIHDYGRSLTRKQKHKLLSSLAVASEVRGTDATGIAYNDADKLTIHKRPWPAHLVRFKVPDDASVVMGHTRMTTQGDEKHNYNNHPFAGRVNGEDFALAHNGVLYNDRSIRNELRLPPTPVETDSYVAVQLIEQSGELSFDSLKDMAETVEGQFTFTVLSERDEMYFVRGDNPMCIYHYPKRGLYVYASTEAILRDAIQRLPFYLGRYQKVDLGCGEILRIDAVGHLSRVDFHFRSSFYDPWIWRTPRPYSYTIEDADDEYLQELKVIAAFYGYSPEDVEMMLAEGFTTDEIEELIYCGEM